MADDSHILKCIILTLKKENVLIPSAVIAEIVSVENIEAVPDTPAWLIGKFKWRDEYIPLVSFEVASGNDVLPNSRSTQVAVFYILNDESGLKEPYVGLMISGVPHVTRFTTDQIKADENRTADHPMVAQYVKVNGVSMGILDVDAMETMVLESGF